MIPQYLKKELNILFYIINKKETSLNEVSLDLKISKRTVKEHIIKINRSFDDYLSITNFISSNSAGNMSVNPEYEHDSLRYAYTLKLYLLKTTVPFTYCLLLVTNVKMSKNELLNSLFISKYYLARVTQQLNTFLAPYEIKIARNKDDYFLIGNELSVRIFSYIFLHDAFQAIEWPFTNISIDEIRKIIPDAILKDSHKRSSSTKRSLYIFYAVLQIRIQSENYLNSPDIDLMVEFFKIVKDKFDVAQIFYEKYFGPLDSDIKNTEVLYFNFLAQIFIPYIFNLDKKKELGDIFLESEHHYCKLSSKIVHGLSALDTVNFPEEKKSIYTFYVTFFNSCYFLVGNKYIKYLNLYSPTAPTARRIDNNFFESIYLLVSSLISNKTQADLLSSFIYDLAITEKKAQLRIYLHMVKNYSTFYSLSNRIESLYNNQNIYVTDNYSIADIVVTDTFETKGSNKKIFYLKSIDDENRWEELTTLIQKTYMKKCTF